MNGNDDSPKPAYTASEYQALLRRDFMTFAHRAFVQLNPQTEFLFNWHLDLIADRLMACMEGRCRRLIINLPPRSLKSHLVSVALPAFWLGRHPSAQIICASYGQELAEKFSTDTRKVMTAEWYEAIFPTRLAPTPNTVRGFHTTAHGARLATSVGGPLTGRGGDLIILDDPQKPEDALSEVARVKVRDWFDTTLYSRLNNKNEGCIILVMQRLHMDDLAGYLCEKGGWEVLNLAALALEEERFEYTTLAGPQAHVRQPGEALHPERESVDTLEGIRASLGEWTFASQYQQTPAPRGGAMVKESWLMRYDLTQLPDRFERTIMSWDTASKASELSDYSVGTVWGVKGKQIYLLYVYRKKVNYPELKQAIKALNQDWNPSEILIEDKASGIQLIQELLHEGVRGIKGIKPEGDKIMRMHAQTTPFEQGRVLLPMQAPWLADYQNELLAFPFSRHDDQVDATAQALKWLHECSQEPGIITYYRYEARKRFENGELDHRTDEEVEALYRNFWEPEEEAIQNRGRRGPDNRLLPHLYPVGHQLWKPKPPGAA